MLHRGSLKVDAPRYFQGARLFFEITRPALREDRRATRYSGRLPKRFL